MIEQEILEAFPGDDPLMRRLRIALWRIINATRAAEHSLEYCASFIFHVIRDTPFELRHGRAEVELSARKFEALASELRKSFAELSALSREWTPPQPPSSPQEDSDVRVRLDRGREEAPF